MLAKKMSLPTLAIFVSGLEVGRRFGGHRQVEFRELLRGLGDLVARGFQFLVGVLRQRRRSGSLSEESRRCGKSEDELPAGEFVGHLPHYNVARGKTLVVREFLDSCLQPQINAYRR